MPGDTPARLFALQEASLRPVRNTGRVLSDLSRVRALRCSPLVRQGTGLSLFVPQLASKKPRGQRRMRSAGNTGASLPIAPPDDGNSDVLAEQQFEPRRIQAVRIPGRRRAFAMQGLSSASDIESPVVRSTGLSVDRIVSVFKSVYTFSLAPVAAFRLPAARPRPPGPRRRIVWQAPICRRSRTVVLRQRR